jgi:uncharacterized protein
MENHEILKLTEQFVKEKCLNEASGHDWWHIHRVVNLARKIAITEGANIFTCEMSALLHDMADDKLCKDPVTAMHECIKKLNFFQVPEQMATHIIEIIDSISFKGGNRLPFEHLKHKLSKMRTD